MPLKNKICITVGFIVQFHVDNRALELQCFSMLKTSKQKAVLAQKHVLYTPAIILHIPVPHVTPNHLQMPHKSATTFKGMNDSCSIQTDKQFPCAIPVRALRSRNHVSISVYTCYPNQTFKTLK